MKASLKISLLGIGAIVLTSLSSCRSKQSSSLKDLTATELAASKDWAGRMGLFLTDVEGGGAQVLQVADFSFADVIGVQAGDVVQEINGAAVQNPQNFQEVLSRLPKRGIMAWRILVRRGEKMVQLSNPPGHSCSPMDLVGCGPVPSYRRR